MVASPKSDPPKLTTTEAAEMNLVPKPTAIRIHSIQIEHKQDSLVLTEIGGQQIPIPRATSTHLTIEADLQSLSLDSDGDFIPKYGTVYLVSPEEYANLEAFGYKSKPPGPDDLLIKLNDARRTASDIEAERCKLESMLMDSDAEIIALKKKIDELEAREPIVYQASF